MSETVMTIIARATQDAAFRNLLIHDPTTALKEYTLNEQERSLLSNLDESKIDEFAGDLDDRLTKGGWIPGGN